MSLDPAILRVMQAKGVDTDTILAVIEADYAKQEAASAARRAKAAAQKKAYRASLKGDQSPLKSAGQPETLEDNPGQSGLDLPPKERSPEPPKEITPIRERVSAQARDGLFARFKAAYPKRKGNPWQPAEEKFYRLIRDGVDPEVIIAGAVAYAATVAGSDPQFTCMASTWLNKGRWKDDYADPAQPPPSPDGSRASAPDRFSYPKDPYLASAVRDRRNHDDQPSRNNVVEHPSAFAAPGSPSIGSLDERTEPSLFGGSAAIGRRYAHR